MQDDSYFISSVEDREVSFNIDRKQWDSEGFSDGWRPVVLRCTRRLRKPVIIPAVDICREKPLLAEIRGYQWVNESAKLSFSIADVFPSSYLFCLLWRFVRSEGTSPLLLFEPLSGKERRTVHRLVENHNQRIGSSLRPGQILMLPDRMVSFGRALSRRKNYARRVLIVASDENQVTFMPFSSRLERVDRRLDIVFDTRSPEGDLRVEAEPAVSNLAFRLFLSRPSLLKVGFAQSVPRREIVECALLPRGMVTPELATLALQRLKRKS